MSNPLDSMREVFSVDVHVNVTSDALRKLRPFGVGGPCIVGERYDIALGGKLLTGGAEGDVWLTLRRAEDETLVFRAVSDRSSEETSDQITGWLEDVNTMAKAIGGTLQHQRRADQSTLQAA